MTKRIDPSVESGSSDLSEALNSLRLERGLDAAPEPRRGWQPLPYAAAFGLGVVAASAVAWFVTDSGPKRSAPTVVSPAATKTAAPVGRLIASGFVVASRQATVSSQVTGRVASIEFEEGQHVAAGQILARIEAGMAASEVEQGRARIDGATAQVEALEAELVEAELAHRRTLALRERGFAPPALLEKSEGRVETLRARVRAARAEGRSARASASGAAVILAHHTIRAPFAGVIISRNAQIGETISPLSAGGGFTRTGICTLVDMNSIAVEVDVGEALIGRVIVGQPVEIRLNSDPDRLYRGRVSQKIPSASRDRGTVRVRIVFDRVDERVIPDLAAKVTFV